MNHKVDNIEQLYNDAKQLLERVVLGSADNVLTTLNAGIDNLKTTWHGADAGVNINDLVNVYNGLAAIRNALAELAVNSSGVAAMYQNIQITNGAPLSPFAGLSFTPKSRLDAYADSSTGASIVPDADNGKQKVDSAKTNFEAFVNEAKTAYNKIMGNWTIGGELRETAVNSFEQFNKEIDNYINVLTKVSTNITNAIANYNF